MMWIYGIYFAADAVVSAGFNSVAVDGFLSVHDLAFVSFLKGLRTFELGPGGIVDSFNSQPMELTTFLPTFSVITQRPELLGAFVVGSHQVWDCRANSVRASFALFWRTLVVYNGLYARFLQSNRCVDVPGRHDGLRSGLRVLKRVANGRRRVGDTGPMDVDYSNDGEDGAGYVCAASGCEARKHLALVCCKCLCVHYCGKQCQRAHWACHKRECRFLRHFEDKLYDGVALPTGGN
jgi:hypothetical protein